MNRISVDAKQRQNHKNFAAFRDKGLSVIQFADTLHVTRKFILEVLAHSWWLFVHSYIPWAVLPGGMATTVFFRRCGMLRSFVVEILQSKNK